MTHTYVVLELSQPAYQEIADKLKAAGYEHAFSFGKDYQGRAVIDMQGIAVAPLSPIGGKRGPR